MVEPTPRQEPDYSVVEFDSGRSQGGCRDCSVAGAPALITVGDDGGNKAYPTTAVRFGYMRYIGEFSYPPNLKFACGAKLIIQTKRGIEMGEQALFTSNDCAHAVTQGEIHEWVKTCGHDSYVFGAGRILREATAADLADYARIQSGCREKRDFCQQMADKHTLPLRIVECECPFGGERIIYYFTAAERVDFRGLVKDLAKEYRTRIEMRQVGARDEARLLADFETCGREICCKAFLKTLKPISMRMAKVQKSTLDPTQVSGRCGRLKCCLRYEHTGYEELDRKLPRVGVRIRTDSDEGVVINRQILTQLVQIRLDNENLLTVAAEDILEAGVKEPSAEARSTGGTAAPPAVVPLPARGRAARPVKKPGKPAPARGNRRTPAARESPAQRPPETQAATSKTPDAPGQGLRRRRRRGRRRRPRQEGNPGGKASASDGG